MPFRPARAHRGEENRAPRCSPQYWSRSSRGSREARSAIVAVARRLALPRGRAVLLGSASRDRGSSSGSRSWWRRAPNATRPPRTLAVRVSARTVKVSRALIDASRVRHQGAYSAARDKRLDGDDTVKLRDEARQRPSEWKTFALLPRHDSVMQPSFPLDVMVRLRILPSSP